MNNILRFMTDDDLKALLLAAVESDGADQQVERMLDAMPIGPMACADAKKIADSVFQADDQAR